MAPQISTDQSAGELTLHTGRAGVGSKVGHDLTLKVETWSATAELADDGGLSALQVTVDLGSLVVVKGDGGLKPLTDKDKATILANARESLRTQAHPVAVFTAEPGRLGDGPQRVTGLLALAGRTGPQQAEATVHRADGTARIEGRAQVLQSAFGIKPYSGMLGALKVRDLVEVRMDVTVSL